MDHETAATGISRPMSRAGDVSSILSTFSSVAVNFAVTAAILFRIMRTRGNALRLQNQITNDLQALARLPSSSSPSFPCDTPGFEHQFFVDNGKLYRSQTQEECRDSFAAARAIFVESALPSAILGTLACLAHPAVAQGGGLARLLDARFTLRILWASVTVRGPLEAPIPRMLTEPHARR